LFRSAAREPLTFSCVAYGENRSIVMPKKASAPWDRANPKSKRGESRPLSPAQKAKAKSAAKSAGRSYPNLVDNMNAAKSK
jgi:hypothetical protein